MTTSAVRLLAALLLLTSGLAVAAEPAQEAIDRANALVHATPFLNCDADSELVETYRFSGWQPAGGIAPETDLQLLQIVCRMGAYNQVSVFIVDDGDTAGLLGLPAPVIEVSRQGDVFESDVAEVRIVGYATNYTFINAFANEDEGVIVEYDRWRGLSDASSITEWRLKEGHFVLEYFAVDATYDQEINPVVIFDLSE